MRMTREVLSKTFVSTVGEGVTRRRLRQRVFASAAGLALVAGAAACGSSHSSNGSSATTVGGSGGNVNAAAMKSAESTLASWEGPAAWAGPSIPVDTSKAKGKTVFFDALTMGIPALATWVNTAAAQLRQAGATVSICDSKGTPGGAVSCFQEGMSQHPAVIFASGLDHVFMQNYFLQAQAAGVKVIDGNGGTPGIPPSNTGAAAAVTFDFHLAGEILGDWFAVQTRCNSPLAIVTSTSAKYASAQEVSGMEAAVKKVCPHIDELPVSNSLIPDWATQLPGLARTLLVGHPELEYIMPIYDGMTFYMASAIQGVHLSHPVHMASLNATAAIVQSELADPTSPLAADLGEPNVWFGYSMADQIFRLLAGDPPVASEGLPYRLFTQATLSNTINVHGSEQSWYGSTDFACEYHKLWGMPC